MVFTTLTHKCQTTKSDPTLVVLLLLLYDDVLEYDDVLPSSIFGAGGHDYFPTVLEYHTSTSKPSLVGIETAPVGIETALAPAWQ